MTTNKFPDFPKAEKELQQFFAQFPHTAGTQALNYYVSSFRRQNWNNIRWKARSKPDAGRAILIKSGRLRRSLRLIIDKNTATISTDTPYAQIHNEGGRVQYTVQIKAHQRRLKRKTITVKAHSRTVNHNMPKRQFMDIPGKPMNAILEKQIIDTATKAIDKIFKP